MKKQDENSELISKGPPFSTADEDRIEPQQREEEQLLPLTDGQYCQRLEALLSQWMESSFLEEKDHEDVESNRQSDDPQEKEKKYRTNQDSNSLVNSPYHQNIVEELWKLHRIPAIMLKLDLHPEEKKKDGRDKANNEALHKKQRELQEHVLSDFIVLLWQLYNQHSETISGKSEEHSIETYFKTFFVSHFLRIVEAFHFTNNNDDDDDDDDENMSTVVSENTARGKKGREKKSQQKEQEGKEKGCNSQGEQCIIHSNSKKVYRSRHRRIPVTAAGLPVNAEVDLVTLWLAFTPLVCHIFTLYQKQTESTCDQKEKFQRRLIIGLSGPAGGGKSVLSALLKIALDQLLGVNGKTKNGGVKEVPGQDSSEEAPSVILMGIDGYHRFNTELEALGIRHMKGRPATLDLERLAKDLHRLKFPSEQPPHAVKANKNATSPAAKENDNERKEEEGGGISLHYLFTIGRSMTLFCIKYQSPLIQNYLRLCYWKAYSYLSIINWGTLTMMK